MQNDVQTLRDWKSYPRNRLLTMDHDGYGVIFMGWMFEFYMECLGLLVLKNAHFLVNSSPSLSLSPRSHTGELCGLGSQAIKALLRGGFERLESAESQSFQRQNALQAWRWAAKQPVEWSSSLLESTCM